MMKFWSGKDSNNIIRSEKLSFRCRGENSFTKIRANGKTFILKFVSAFTTKTKLKTSIMNSGMAVKRRGSLIFISHRKKTMLVPASARCRKIKLNPSFISRHKKTKLIPHGSNSTLMLLVFKTHIIVIPSIQPITVVLRSHGTSTIDSSTTRLFMIRDWSQNIHATCNWSYILYVMIHVSLGLHV